MKDIAPGVKLFGNGNLIVFKPERPDFWLPVTMRELAAIYLEYYIQLKDEFMPLYLKKEIAEISEEEMNAPACSGNDERTFFRFNGKGEGLQIMRFNPDYWDRSLPSSAIQFMTFGYAQTSDAVMEEKFRNNGHPPYSQLVVNQINWSELQQLFVPKK